METVTKISVLCISETWDEALISTKQSELCN